MPETPTTYNYYPALSGLMTAEELPEILGFIRDGLQQIFDKVYYKNFYASVNSDGSFAYYSLDLVSRTKLAVEFPGTGIYFVLNPDYEDTTITSFPISLQWNQRILRYLGRFSSDQFSFSQEDFFNLALEIFEVSEADSLQLAQNTFVEVTLPGVSRFQQLVSDINSLYGSSIQIDENLDARYELLAAQIHGIGQQVFPTVFTLYLTAPTLEETKERVSYYFSSFISGDLEQFILSTMSVGARATLELSAAIEFPHNILRPVTENGEEIPNQLTRFVFARALLYADTRAGIGYQMDLSGSLMPPFASVANTGLILHIDTLKVDLSTNSNIIEADLDGRPDSFVGVYARAISVTFPPRWFHNDDQPETGNVTLRLGGYDLLLGTGGLSGTITLESVPIVSTTFNYYNDRFTFVYPVTLYEKDPDTEEVRERSFANYTTLNSYLQNLNNTSEAPFPFKYPLSLIPIGSSETLTFENAYTYQKYLSTLNDGILWKRLGGEEGFRVGFKSFDLTFQQNEIVSSGIAGSLEIPRFTYPEGTIVDGQDVGGQIVRIDVVGAFANSGDFLLTASAYPPFPIELGDILRLHLKSVELGREGGDFFIGASCDLEFLGLLGSFLEGQSISIASLRIYSNGRIEFHVEGGNLTLPKPVKFNLGPVELSVTALHFGSHEREKDGIIRKYNYFGFDGGISVGIAGVDARGDGIKFYYTIDDGPGKAPDRYLHIQTIHVDLVLPANSSDPTVMLNGWLSIPEPGVSTEYRGGISLKLKNPRISGSVNMRLAPRYPAFLIDAGIELPNPIPLGAVSIYGFRGLLGYRYVAEKQAIGMTSENSWYEYYKAPVRGVGVEKFSGPEQTQGYNNPVSLGVGAIIGDTMALGNIFSANAMLLLSLPSMIMVDARMKLLASRVTFAEDPPFFAGFIIGDNSMEFFFGADYKFPENSGDIIKLYAEIQAGFFFNNPSAWYINLGTEQVPIQASLLKDLFSLKAYVMLSGQGIRAGARGEFRFERNLGPVGLKFLAYMELGGRISFERPQMGGYFELGVEVGLKLVIVDFYLAVSLLVAVESPRPFLIYGKFDLTIKIKVFGVRIANISGTIELKWEYNREVDRTPVNPMSEAPEIVEGLVKGISMLTGETFNLLNLKQSDGSIKIDEGEIRKKVVPLDTYIDLRTTKGLLPEAEVSELIGGFTNPAGSHTDLIPPEKIMKGIELRQVKHQYSIESIEIMAHTPEGWQPYHPYKAMYPTDSHELLDTLKSGYWQKKDDTYNAIRILANNPFSYSEQGEPGWFVPEYYGVDGHTLFCEGTEKKWKTSDFLHKPLGTIYYASNDLFFYSMEASYRIVGTTEYHISDNGGVVYEGASGFVTDYPNIFAFRQSLAYPKNQPLVIMLSAPSVKVALKLSVDFGQTTIAIYRPVIEDTSEFTSYVLVESRELSPGELTDAVFFDTSLQEAVTRIVITPSETGFTGSGLMSGLLKSEIETSYRELLSDYEQMFFMPYRFIPDDKQPDEETKRWEWCDFIAENVQGKQYDKIVSTLQQIRIESKVFPLYRDEFEQQLIKLQDIVKDTYGKYTDPILTQFDVLKARLSQIFDLLEPLRDVSDEPLGNLADQLRFQEKIFIDNRAPEMYSPVLNILDGFIKENPQYDFLYHILRRRYEVLSQIIASGPSAYLDNRLAAMAYNEATISMIGSIAQVSNRFYSGKTHDLLHEVSWLTLEDYQYNIHIPSQQHITEEVEAMVSSVNKYLPPVWRPDTSYYIRFRLKDDIDNGEDTAAFEYAFGFHTAGPVGFFHTDAYSPYGPLPYEEQDQYPHTSLRAYIDYERSYPNADGDLVSAKPLFYNDTTTEVSLFFRHRYTEKLLGGWEAYNGMPALGGTMKLMIKDPIEEVGITNPPNLEATEESIWLSNPSLPQTIESWAVDAFPLMDNVTQQWFNMLQDGCVQVSDPAKPLAYYRRIELKRLKAQKLYTVQVLNFYWGADPSVDPENISPADKDRYARSIHEYVFQTSRYRNFGEQIRSFYRFAEDETTIAHQALYTIGKELTQAVLIAAFSTIAGMPDAMSNSIAIQFQHPFDRVIEGLFGLPAMDKAVVTEINRIVDTNTGQVAALLIRSPEPFNNPRFPLAAISRSEEQEGMIEILTEDQSHTDDLYRVLYSKDYAQALIMYDAGYITAEQIHIRFIYRMWNGSTYIVADTQELHHLPIN